MQILQRRAGLHPGGGFAARGAALSIGERIMDKPMDAFAHSPGLPPVARVATLQSLHWLALGWKDFADHPGPCVAHVLILFYILWLVL
ncbi:MAG: hypothetical protein ACREXT_03020, partial [Gammaproteobacteria bacterium]